MTVSSKYATKEHDVEIEEALDHQIRTPITGFSLGHSICKASDGITLVGWIQSSLIVVLDKLAVCLASAYVWTYVVIREIPGCEIDIPLVACIRRSSICSNAICNSTLKMVFPKSARHLEWCALRERVVEMSCILGGHENSGMLRRWKKEAIIYILLFPWYNTFP